MKPVSISEKMMYNTVRLTTSNGSCGTGSFFIFELDKKAVPVIITNKHVVNDNQLEETTFHLHTANDNGEPDSNLKVTYRTNWIFHESKNLCYCYFNPLFEHIQSAFGKCVYFTANNESNIPTEIKLQELGAIEELVMVGYPIGLWDKRNNFPIFRKGYTACHPSIDFNTDGVGLADIACFPGSSGSPIYILNEGSYRDKKGNTYMGSTMFMLMGYLFAGPVHTATGDLVVQNIPTHQKITTNTPTMINLGYYVKSFELLEFKHRIKTEMYPIS